MRILVTGGAGFICSHLTDKLLALGHDVIGIDNLITGSMDNIAHHESDPHYTFIRHDVTNFIDISGPIDIIFHFASPASPIDYLKLPIQTLKVGSLGTHKALGLAKAKNARFMLASTSEVYGDPLIHPQTEDYWGNVNPIGPRGVYDEAKRFAEAITMAYQRTHGLQTRIVRIFNTYGPRMRVNDGRVVPNFIAQALTGQPITIYGDGSQTRSFCFVSDLIEGITRLAFSDVPTPVNIGNPEEFTILGFAELVRDLIGNSVKFKFEPLPEDDPKTRKPDISLAKKHLDWTPAISVREGLEKTIPYFEEQIRKGSLA